MRKAYVVLLTLLMVAIFVQFYLAAMGALSKPVDDNSFTPHKINGMMVIPSLAVLATIVAAIGRVGRKLVGLTILPALLIPLQILITNVGGANDAHTATWGRFLLGLHAINGLLIMNFARMALMQGRAMLKQKKAGAAPAATADPALSAAE